VNKYEVIKKTAVAPAIVAICLFVVVAVATF